MSSGPSVSFPRGAIAVALGLVLGASLLAGVDDGRSAPPRTQRQDLSAGICRPLTEKSSSWDWRLDRACLRHAT